MNEIFTHKSVMRNLLVRIVTTVFVLGLVSGKHTIRHKIVSALARVIPVHGVPLIAYDGKFSDLFGKTKIRF